MKKFTYCTILMLALARSAAAAEPDNAHVMRDAAGEPLIERCAACHADDMSLLRSKTESCTLCHGESPHAGARLHLQKTAESVKRALGEKAASSPLLFTDEGTIYCGTCHYFHDPVVAQEEHQKEAWIPLRSGVAGAIGRGVEKRWAELAKPAGEEESVARLADESTAALRLPVRDGTLCLHCHAEMK